MPAFSCLVSKKFGHASYSNRYPPSAVHTSLRIFALLQRPTRDGRGIPTCMHSNQVFDGAIRCVLERNQRKLKKKKGKKNCVIS